MLKVKDYTKFSFGRSYMSACTPFIQQGHVVKRWTPEGDEYGVVLAVHSNNEVRTDEWGMCDLAELTFPTRSEIDVYALKISLELQDKDYDKEAMQAFHMASHLQMLNNLYKRPLQEALGNMCFNFITLEEFMQGSNADFVNRLPLVTIYWEGEDIRRYPVLAIDSGRITCAIKVEDKYITYDLYMKQILRIDELLDIYYFIQKNKLI